MHTSKMSLINFVKLITIFIFSLIKLIKSGSVNITVGLSSGIIQLWEPFQPYQYSNFFLTNSHTLQVNALKLINESVLASGSNDGYIKIWSYLTGVCLRSINVVYKVNALELLNSGYLAAATDNGTISIWNINTGAQIANISAHSTKVNTLELLDNGDLASGAFENWVKVWDSVTYALKYSMTGDDRVNYLKKFNSIYLASGLDNNDINIFNTNTRALYRTLSGHTAPVRSFEILSNGDLVSGADDRKLKFWNTTTFTFKYDLSARQMVVALKLFANEFLACATSDKYVSILNISNGTNLNQFNIGINVASLEALETNSSISTTTSSTSTSTLTSTSTTITSSSTTTPMTTSITDTTLTSTTSSSTSTTISSSSTLITTSSSSTSTTTTMSSINQTNLLTPVILYLNMTQTFNFVQLSATQTVNLLSSAYDISACLANCTNNGICEFDSINQKFNCLCNPNFAGSACQINTSPCWVNKCMNNATCVNNISSLANKSYSCQCNQNYYGEYCEFKVDLCKNETCSNHGRCIDFESRPKCQCFSLYEGEKCEIVSNELKTLKSIISVSSIVAICIVGCLYGIFVFMDISNYATRKKKSNRIDYI